MSPCSVRPSGPISNWRAALNPDIITVPDFKTIRTLRRQRLSDAPVVIVSANAFD